MINQKILNRNSLILTGVIGVVGAMFITALCIFIAAQAWVPLVFSNTLYIWLFFLFLAVFSVAEIPVMIVGMRRIAAGDSPRADYVVLFTNAIYTLFAAVYAAPFIVLTGGIWSGLVLASLTLARFASSIIFLPQGK